VVLASEGYPEAPRTGDLIAGLEDGVDGGDAMVLHAGTAPAPGAGGSGRSVITSGGRVLNVVALGTTIEEARTRAYEKASHISWPGMQRRSDIAGSGSFEASGTLTGPGPVSMPEVSDQPETQPETQEVAG
jgi:phosphoribosylamine--glycine ligase